jgi:hypothetical protein
MAMNTDILTWNDFTSTFSIFMLDYNNKRDADKVIPLFSPYIDKYGYDRVRHLIESVYNLWMDEATYLTPTFDVIGYKPAWYDYKYAKRYILEILDTKFI